MGHGRTRKGPPCFISGPATVRPFKDPAGARGASRSHPGAAGKRADGAEAGDIWS